MNNKQSQTIDLIVTTSKTYKEIGKIVGFSRETIRQYAKKIKELGYKFPVRKGGFRPKKIGFMIDCACGCGQRLINIDKRGCNRKYIFGHSKNSGRTDLTDLTRKLTELFNENKTPVTNKYIYEKIGVETSAVTTNLSRLKKRGKIIHLGYGLWQASPKGD